MGEFFASRKPVVVQTVLGSCVAACLFDPETGCGGMNHFLLPGGEEEMDTAGRYGSQAMHLLIQEIVNQGATGAVSGPRYSAGRKCSGGGHHT